VTSSKTSSDGVPPAHDSFPDGPCCAIVLAGRRSADDPLAKAAGASHRALLDIEGEPMLVRVVKRLNTWPTIERILINIDEPALLRELPELMALHEKGVVEFMNSTDSPSRSVMESLRWADLERGPVLVTTADHALLDDEMLGMFFRESARLEADLTFGLVSRTTIEARFPEAKRTYLRFRDGAFSGANLFLFRTPNAKRAAAFWRRVEQERKHPWRIARAFGIGTLLLFLTRRLDLDAALLRASNVVGARVQAIRLTIAEAAVDVDKIEDLELVRRILAERATET
jgi:GTP:adenosylcobinamide-phosphate guanylyltransferase